jgi:hypothetical protein
MKKRSLVARRTLAEQLNRGPRSLHLCRLLQIDLVLSLIEADKVYSYDFIRHALTGCPSIPKTSSGPVGEVDGGPRPAARIRDLEVVVLPQNASKCVKMRRFAKTAEIAKMLPTKALRANRRKAVRSSQAGRRGFESHRPLS